MKPVNVKWNTYIDPSKDVNSKDPKFKLGGVVRISKYKNAFAKGYTLNCSEEFFVIKKVRKTVPWTYVFNDINGDEIDGTAYKIGLLKTNQKEFKIERVIKKAINYMLNEKDTIILGRAR